MRGTVLSIISWLSSCGIIPACAGNRVVGGSNCTKSRDHPRVCGEQSLASLTDRIQKGSSPRVRGTAWSETREAIADGIIPACAGNSERWYETNPSLGDHPRVCGEQFLPSGAKSVCSGSSPRVRGTADPTRCIMQNSGIIPACAGNRLVLKY